MFYLKNFLLFSLTALFEIIGCYCLWVIVKENKSNWLIVPSVISLLLFSYLLTFHPTASGRTYAAYGGVYIFIALLWLYFVDKVVLTRYDIIGALLAISGMCVIMFQPK